MDTIVKQLEAFLLEDNFITKLRFLKGIDGESVNRFIQMLNAIKDEVGDSNMIRKEIPYYLFEIIPVLMSNRDQYPVDQQREIDNLIAELSERISDVFI